MRLSWRTELKTLAVIGITVAIMLSVSECERRKEETIKNSITPGAYEQFKQERRHELQGEKSDPRG